MLRSRLTLAAVFTATAIGLLALGAGVFGLIWKSSERTVQEGARRLRENALDRTEDAVETYMRGTRAAMAELQQSFSSGRCTDAPGRGLESCLMSRLMSEPHLASIGFTHAELEGYDEGEPRFAARDRWSLEVYRAAGTEMSPLCTRWVNPGDAGGYVERTACQSPEEALLPPKFQVLEIADGGDPVEDRPFFSTPASERFRGLPQDTSLFPSPHDIDLSPNKRRFVYSTVESVERDDGGFAGVLDVSQVFGQLSEIVRNTQVNPDPDAGFTVFLCDNQGNFITGFTKDDVLVEDEDSFHVDPACAPKEVASAVKSPLLQQLDLDHLNVDGVVDFQGQRYVTAFRALTVGHRWAIGIVGPESYYLKALEEQRAQMVKAVLLLLGLVLLIGLAALRSIRRALQSVQLQTDRITRFEFTGAEVKSPFRDVRDVLDSIEHAKTAVRAMGKYVPLDLVRQLFRDNIEPAPGGELRQISMMFTDIEGFTTLVEKEPPERIASWLGQYLSTMTTAIHSTHGTVDKFIGDAVMALWNAPSLDADHVLNACRGALACIDATARLFASSEWAGRPALVTRFGLHRAQVMVGHFGAPDRLSYTAIGDGVNLASRLEGLNKEYGTRVLASEAVWQLAKDAFVFRKLDRVAVKGKAEAIDVYELLGERGVEVGAHVRSYEAALEAYFKRDFERAANTLQGSVDGPSRVLRERCLEMQKTAPPGDWNGVWVLHSK